MAGVADKFPGALGNSFHHCVKEREIKSASGNHAKASVRGTHAKFRHSVREGRRENTQYSYLDKSFPEIRSAREVAQERFSIERFVRDWNRVFADVVGTPRTAASMTVPS